MERKSLMSDKLFFEKCVSESKTVKETLLRLGYSNPSNYYSAYKRYVIKYGTDTSHFITRNEIIKNAQNFSPRKKQILEDVLVENYVGGSTGNDIKKKLYKANLKNEECELCGLKPDEWITGKICLILDHINGNHRDNRIENLRIVCPNCDSTLPTFKNKNKKIKLNNDLIIKRLTDNYK